MQPYLDALGKDASSVDPALLQALRGAHAHAADAVADVEARVAALLPPRYRDAVTAVSPAPMSAADLEFDARWSGCVGPDMAGVL